MLALFILTFHVVLLSAHPLQQTAPRIISVAWSPDGTKLAITGGPEVCDNPDLSLYDVRIVNPATNQTLLNLSGNRCYLTSLTWSPDGSKLMGASLRRVHIWNALTGQLVSDNIRGQGFISARWMPDGNSVIVTDVGGGISRNDANTGQTILAFRYALASVIDLNPAGTQLVGGQFRDNLLRIVDIDTGELVSNLSGHTSGIFSVDWSPDGSKIASGSDDGNVRIWNATSGARLLSLSAHTGTVTSVAWNPDNRLLSTTGVDGKLRIWDTNNGQMVSEVSAVGFIYDAAWSPDGSKLAYGGASSNVNVIAPSISGTPTATPILTPSATAAGASTATPTATLTPTRTPTATASATAATGQPLTFQINQGSDDVNQVTTTLTTGNNEVWVGNSGSVTSSFLGLRFNNITIPRNAVIASAYLEFYSSKSQSFPNPLMAEIRIEAADNAATFSSGSLPGQRPTTSAVVSNNSGLTSGTPSRLAWKASFRKWSTAPAGKAAIAWPSSSKAPPRTRLGGASSAALSIIPAWRLAW
jgi:WD40 repeat protein